MRTDSVKKYVIPNIPYLFILWACLKLGTAYRLAPGADFAHKLMGLGQSIGPAFADFAPGLHPLDWLIGIVGAVGFRLLIYMKGIVHIPAAGHPVKVLWGLHLDAVRGGPVAHELAHRLFAVGCLAGLVRFLDLPAHRQTRLGQHPARELCRLDGNCYGTSGNVLINQPYPSFP